MAKEISSVRTKLLYCSAARLMWKPKYGPIPGKGVFNGYIVTAFSSELELRHHVKEYKYSELIRRCGWKVGTAELTQARLDRMFKDKSAPLTDPAVQIWDRYMIPYTDRLATYACSTRKLQPAACAYMKDVLVPLYVESGYNAALLMFPLILAYPGTAASLEKQMSEMVVKAGGIVHNDKAVQESKERSKPTEVTIDIADRKADKLLKLTPTLEAMGFEVHADFQKKKK